MAKKKTERMFNSIEEIEKKYFPKSSRLMEAKRITDAKTLGIIMARSSLEKIKTLTVE